MRDELAGCSAQGKRGETLSHRPIWNSNSRVPLIYIAFHFTSETARARAYKQTRIIHTHTHTHTHKRTPNWRGFGIGRRHWVARGVDGKKRSCRVLDLLHFIYSFCNRPPPFVRPSVKRSVCGLSDCSNARLHTRTHTHL